MGGRKGGRKKYINKFLKILKIKRFKKNGMNKMDIDIDGVETKVLIQYYLRLGGSKGPLLDPLH